MSAFNPSSPSLASMSFSSNDLSAHFGVVRSRTLLFQSYRDSVPRTSKTWSPRYSNESDPTSSLVLPPDTKGKRKAGTYFDASGELHEDSDATEASQMAYPPRQHQSIDMGSLPPQWVDVSDEVDGILSGLQPKIANLDRLHAKHVLPGFSDRTSEEREIEKETRDITLQFRKCSKLIATLADHTKMLARSGRASAREIAMATNVQTALATKVQDASGGFRRKQTNYMQRLRGHEERSQGISRDSETALQEDMEIVSGLLDAFQW